VGLSSLALFKGVKMGTIGMRGALVPFVAMTLTLLAAVGTLLAFGISPARGAVPNGFTQSQVASGLEAPTDMEFAPDGRLFVTEQAGKVRIVKPDGTLAKFLDISSKVDTAGERGLLGIAFDPDFATNHYVYLYYTRKATSTTPVHNRVVRVTASGDTTIVGSKVLIFRLNNQSAQNHQGGAIGFGPDGKLYISSGDNNTGANAQSLDNLFGKILRINKDGTIPTDNPFYNTASGNNRAIWALGLRNPFKFAIKPGTSTIFINDVGEGIWEEINQGAWGANYGWPIYEGPESDANFIPPIFAYGHGSTNTTGCAITGGAFYNPATVRFPSGYVGDYFFADYCNGWIRSYDPATETVSELATGLGSIVDLEVNSDGRLYYLSRGNPGLVGKIGYSSGY
jgi:glucose/arabinose dehydrogenase